MQPKVIPGYTRVLGAPPNWTPEQSHCEALPIVDHDDGDGHWMISLWEPTPAELEELKAGARVVLWVGGMQHPVVAISTQKLE